MGLFDDFYNQKPVLPTAPLPQVAGPAAGPVDPMHMLLMSLLTPRQNQQQNQIPWHELLNSVQNPGQYSDPVGFANRVTGMPSYQPGSQSPFNTGFFGPSLSPEARIASQGPTATNQWALRGGVPGVDAGVLRDLMNPPRKPNSY